MVESESSVIYLEAMGGLANRMRLIASALWLDRMVPSSVVCFWDENAELNCPFSMLFQPIHGVTVVPGSGKFKFVRSNNQRSSFKRYAAKVVNRLSGVDYCIDEKDFAELVWPGKLDIARVKRNHRRIYFRTFEEFGDNALDLTRLRPVNDLQHTIDEVSAGFASDTIGVHIRRGDHPTAAERSPEKIFVEKMSVEIERDPHARFFLCTDDSEVERRFKEAFGSRVRTHSREKSRSAPEGVRSALVDLYCLSRTRKIIGSYQSSFSEVAARLGGVELSV